MAGSDASATNKHITANLAGKGLGVLATRAIKPGQVLLAEHPFARVDKAPGSPDARTNPKCMRLMGEVMQMAKSGRFNPRSEFRQWPLEVVEAFERILDEQAKMAFARLDDEKKTKWMALSDVHAADADDATKQQSEDDTNHGNKTPGGILRTNGIDDATNHANLYETLSRINHSCAPNAIRYSTDASNGGVAVVAQRDIPEGDEILISYMDGADEGMGVDERRVHLKQQYHFHCVCELCLKQEKKS